MQFVSEPLMPIGGFDADAMSRGEPGLPAGFRWRKRTLDIAEVLESAKEHGDCKHGSGERYLRKHAYRLRTMDGLVLKVYFQRSFGKAGKSTSRWWLQSVQEPVAGLGRQNILPKLAA
jgi:Family of unknown function (DUF6504)